MEPIVWLVLMLVFLVLEGMTVAMVSTWFAAGALAALIASVCGAELWLQLLLFTLVSCILLALLRPLVKKYVNPRITRTNVDSVVGTTGYLLETVDNVLPSGKVKLGGMEWTARSQSGEPIPQGTLVKVERIEGVKVFVSPVKAEEPAKI